MRQAMHAMHHNWPNYGEGRSTAEFEQIYKEELKNAGLA